MRYTLNFKIEVIAYYQQGHTGLATSEVFKVNLKLVQKWVNQYQSGGIEAIKPKESKAFYGYVIEAVAFTTH
jgi:transposase